MDLVQIIKYAEYGLEAAGAIVFLATAAAYVVDFFAKKKSGFGKVVAKIAGYLQKALQYAPTLGINPKTKDTEAALAAALKRLKK